MHKITLIAIFLLSALSLKTIGTSLRYEAPVMIINVESGIDTMNLSLNKDDKKQTQTSGSKSGSVKKVKSARPDMSKSRGARPPAIVRPSGSRIPKGVGRPAGAVRHGHG